MADMNNGSGFTKADVILSKLDRLSQQTAAIEQRMSASGNEVVLRKIAELNAKLEQEIRYVSAQLESVCETLTGLINKLPSKISTNAGGLDVDDIASRVASKIVIPENDVADIDTDALADKLNASPLTIDYEELGFSVAKKMYVPQAVAQEIDYDELAAKIARSMPSSPVVQPVVVEPIASKIAEVPVQAAIDYDALAAKVAGVIPVQQPVAVQSEIDYDALAAKVAGVIPAQPVSVQSEIDYDALAAKVAGVIPVQQPVAMQTEIDYDELAAKVADALAVQEPISPDYIAARVAEQIVIPQTVAAQAPALDIEELSRKVADKIALPAIDTTGLTVDVEKLASAVADRLAIQDSAPVEHTETINEEQLAENIANRLNFSLSDQLIAEAVVKNLAGAIDSDEIADCVAKRVGSISPEQFEITVDDDGCDSLARAVEKKLDYAALASAIADKVNPAYMGSASLEDFDAEELARAISEKISVTTDINEDAIADKAAAILSNYMPEIDTSDLADKVIAGVIPALPSAPVLDSDVIAATVTDRLIENQADTDYDIVIDEEGLGRISEGVSEEITKEYAERFDKLDSDVAEIKEMLLSGVVVAGSVVTETAATEAVVEEEPEEEEELVTVSEIVGEEEVEEEEPVEEVVEEVVEEEPVEEEPAPVEEIVEEEPEEVVEEEPVEEPKDIIEEIVEEIDEEPSDGEIMPDGIDSDDGVDFANMMKYNRSFIARIIQGSDDQKNYYGQVKTALLSYRKVNSNVAWGAERFNKGRETVARFKIRGKTLCLYLALDPNDYATSVYHHADVSDNKSMRGTPMMVKIKSPLGVKKAIRLIDEMLERRGGIKHRVAERDYASMYPYETMEELIEDGLVKDVSKK